MLLAVDTYYFNDKAHSVVILFEDWGDSSFQEVYTESREDIEESVAGEFYRCENSKLNHSSFNQVNLKNTVFKNCELQEVDFSSSDLSAAAFEGSDLFRANFDGARLEKADLRSAVNYSIDPEKSVIKKAKFSSQGLSGLLEKYDIEVE